MRIRTKFTIIFLCMVAIPMFFVGTLIFNKSRENLLIEINKKLNIVATLKTENISQLFRELKSDILSMQDYYNIKFNLPIIIATSKNKQNKKYIQAKDMLNDQLSTWVKYKENVIDLMLIAPDGKIVYVVNPKHKAKKLGKPLLDPKNLAFEQGKKGIYFTEVFRNENENNNPFLLATGPVYDLVGNFVGIIALELDMAGIYKIMLDRTGLGVTEDSYLINKDKLMISPSKFIDNSVLNIKVDTENARNCFLKVDNGKDLNKIKQKKDITVFLDYRGVKVFGTNAYIPELQWGLLVEIDATEAFVTINNLRNLSRIIFIIVLLLVFIISISTSQALTKPIKELHNGLEIIGKGNLNYKVGTTAKDEIGMLSRAFDKMILSLKKVTASRDDLNKEIEKRSQAEKLIKAKNDQLQRQTEELQNQADELQQTSDELQEQNFELEMQQKQIENVSKLKSEFLSNMSHELRTPLNSVLALSKIMQMNENKTLTKDELKYLGIIEKNGTQLLNLINDILDLTKIESGKMDIIFEQISLNEIVNQVYLILSPLAVEKDLSFNLDLPDENMLIQSDEAILKNILRNLIANAVKFTLKGSVDIKVHSTEDNIIIDIIDTGIGIKEEEMETIFDQFRQVDGSSTRNFEGTGLGLTIALKSANILGGKINVESKINKGSTFSLILPQNNPMQIEQSNILPIKKITNVYAEKDKIFVIAQRENIVERIISITGQDLNFVYLPSIKNIFNELSIYKKLPVILEEDFLKSETKKSIKNFSVLINKLNLPLALLTGDNPDEKIKKLFKTKKSQFFSIKSIENDNNKYILSKFLTENIEEAKDLSKRNVLLIDDKEEAVIQVKHILEELDINTSIATSGKKVIESAQKTIPDAIILDLMMPEIDGFQVLETIRSKIETKFIPVIILTAKDLSKDEIGKLTANNVYQIMTKGVINRNDLRDVLNDLFKINLPNPHKIKKAESSEKKYKKNITILIVEDNPDNLLVLTVSLKNRYNILTATDGKKGLDLALKKKPGLILLDLSLPIMDGYKVAEKLKNNIDTKDIPIIAVTAKAMKGDKEKVLESGFDNYMSKPIDPEKLLKLVEKYI